MRFNDITQHANASECFTEKHKKIINITTKRKLKIILSLMIIATIKIILSTTYC